MLALCGAVVLFCCCQNGRQAALISRSMYHAVGIKLPNQIFKRLVFPPKTWLAICVAANQWLYIYIYILNLIHCFCFCQWATSCSDVHKSYAWIICQVNLLFSVYVINSNRFNAAIINLYWTEKRKTKTKCNSQHSVYLMHSKFLYIWILTESWTFLFIHIFIVNDNGLSFDYYFFSLPVVVEWKWSCHNMLAYQILNIAEMWYNPITDIYIVVWMTGNTEVWTQTQIKKKKTEQFSFILLATNQQILLLFYVKLFCLKNFHLFVSDECDV